MTRKTKLPRFVPTQHQRIDAARFVAYELWMLRACADMTKPETRVVKNLWYEGLVLHARVLRDFFFTKHKNGARDTRPDDIVAVDYFTAGSSSWPHTSDHLPTYLKVNKARMDRTLAHLSFDRLKYTGKDKDWSAASIRIEIGEKWFEFLAKLHAMNEPAERWFLDQAHRLKIPVVSPF